MQGDFFGTTLNRAARLLDAGHGGQVLCALVTAELTRERLPPEVELVDLGEHRLRDLAAPEHVFQVVAADLPGRFPPLRSLTATRNNLPIVPTALFGREHELAQLPDLLASAPVVSLIGVGGVGKTRLALELAARVAGRFPDGVFFVELATVTDPGSVQTAVASTLGVSSSRARASIRDVLLMAVAAQRLLLVLDNCEHLIEGCADLVEAVVAAAPGVRVLVTSREALGVPAEQLWPVQPLAHAEEDAAAAQLFLERAQAVRPGFQLGPGEQETVSAICGRLDGLPLAIELAAARVAHLTLGQIAERLDDRFRLLTGGRRRVGRHQTLRTTIGWSCDLLDEAERRLLRRLGAFAGPFTLDAVEGVCFPDGDPADTLDLLGALVDKSLVVADLGPDLPRYRLLETVRAFAEEELAEAEESERVRRQHRDWLVEFVAAAADNRTGLVGQSAWDRLWPLYGDVGAAIEWSLERAEHEAAARLLAGTMPHFLDTPDVEERLRWFRRIFDEAAELPADLLAHTYGLFASTAILTAAEDARAIALAASTVPPRPHPVAWAMRALFESIGAAADPALEAAVRRQIQHALDGIGAGAGSRPLGAGVKPVLAQALTNLELFDEAILMAREALDELDDPREHWFADLQARSAIAAAAHLLGCDDESYAAVRPLFDDPDGSALADVSLAMHSAPLAVPLAAHGRSAEARDLLRRAAEAVRRTGLALGRTECLVGLAIVASIEEDFERASRLLGAAIAAIDGALLFRSPSSGYLYLHHRARVRAALSPERAKALRDEGRALSYEDALALGLGAPDPSARP